MIRPPSKLLVPTNKSHFRLYDDPDSVNSNDYIMNGEKQYMVINYVFTKVLKIITDYKFNTTDSPNAKIVIDLMDDIRFDIHSRDESLSDRNLTRNYF